MDTASSMQLWVTWHQVHESVTVHKHTSKVYANGAAIYGTRLKTRAFWLPETSVALGSGDVEPFASSQRHVNANLPE